jgi:hypothetical protein
MIRLATAKDAKLISAFLSAQFAAHPEMGGDPAFWSEKNIVEMLGGSIRAMLGLTAGKVTAAIAWVECEDLDGPYWDILFGIADMALPDDAGGLSARSRALDAVTEAVCAACLKAGVKRAFTRQQPDTPGQTYMEGLGCRAEETGTGRVIIPIDVEDFVARVRARK